MPMEADWEVEIGPGAPVIDARWAGFVDLRQTPEQALQLSEVASLPSLADVLVRLNGVESPIWTSKCDLWPVVDPAEFHPDEMDASAENATHAWACYTDLLSRNGEQWNDPALAVEWCRSICKRLHGVSLTHCRADLIVRQALISAANIGVGITAYLTACGPTAENANQVLQSALRTFTDAVCTSSTLE